MEKDSHSVIATYENSIQELEGRKVELSEKIKNCGTALPDSDDTLRTSFGFLSNSHKIWSSDKLEGKRTVLKLVFSEKLPYHRNEGFRTTQYVLPFTFLEDLKQGNYEMVQRKGEISNSLFRTFEEWNAALKGASLDIPHIPS